MACSRCVAARQSASRAVRSVAAGRLAEAASAARQAASEIRSKIAESDRIRSITRRKPHG